MEPTDQQIDAVRTQFLEKFESADDPALFHPADIARIKNNNDWLRRFLLHHDLDVNNAASMVWDTCEWRKSFGANEITENNVKREYLEEGNMFVHNRDVDGKSLLIMKSKKHIKGQKNMEELKRCTVYWFERIERMDKGEQISIFFDMADTGLSNMDMEYTKYLINLFKAYYPDFLNYILVFEMPWILNAAFKIIKTWLPAKAVQKIKFVSKSNLKEFVAPDQMLTCWGGQDDFEFTFIPEERLPTSDDIKKKVHFAEGSPMVETFPSLGEASGNGDNATASTSSSLSIPNDTINFINDGTELTGTITITNVGDKIISYKVKTTSPEKFRVRPSCGTLQAGATVTINVQLLPGFMLSALARDKFLVMHLVLSNPVLTTAEIADLWKNPASKIEQHRLKCTVASNNEPSIRNGSAYGTLGSNDATDKEIAALIAKVAQLNRNHVILHSDVKYLRKLLGVTTFLVLLFGIAIIYILKIENPHSQKSSGHCYANDM